MPDSEIKPAKQATDYDVAIAGGGVAGLSLAILLARQQYRVVLFEKEQYPFHKVCGEYISMESWNFLKALGLDMAALHPSLIDRLQLSSPTGTVIETTLPLGGFGISRYLLDFSLVELARSAGAIVMENTRVNDIIFEENRFEIVTSVGNYTAKVACGSFGKRSSLDTKWKRPFILSRKNRLNNYIGVKYHVKINFPIDTIALHNFDDGYCGLVKIEGNKYNLCYLTKAANLKRSNSSVKQMEQTVLSKNPLLKKIFEDVEPLFDPITISQVSFEKKEQVRDHVLFIGDAAGMIAPLCGNGMSMALHAGKLASACITEFLCGQLGREEMETQYRKRWKEYFARRLYTGRLIQRLFGRSWLTNAVIKLLKAFPSLVSKIIQQTHGKPF